jgi:hypothetical protein
LPDQSIRRLWQLLWNLTANLLRDLRTANTICPTLCRPDEDNLTTLLIQFADQLRQTQWIFGTAIENTGRGYLSNANIKLPTMLSSPNEI